MAKLTFAWPFGYDDFAAAATETTWSLNDVSPITLSMTYAAPAAQWTETYWTPGEVAFNDAGAAATQVGATLDVSWRIRAIAGTQLSVSWRIRVLIASAAQLSWGLRNVAIATAAVSWRIRSVVASALATSWRLLVTVAQGQDLNWKILAIPEVVRPYVGFVLPPARQRKQVRAYLELNWRIRSAEARAVLETVWRIHRPIAPAQLELAWRVRDPITSTTWYRQLLAEIDDDLPLVQDALERVA